MLEVFPKPVTHLSENLIAKKEPKQTNLWLGTLLDASIVVPAAHLSATHKATDEIEPGPPVAMGTRSLFARATFHFHSFQGSESFQKTSRNP